MWPTFYGNGRRTCEKGPPSRLALQHKSAASGGIEERSKQELVCRRTGKHSVRNNGAQVDNCQEWIRSRDSEEAVDAATDSFDNESRQTNGISARYDPDSYYVLVPADSVLASQPCPICQEKFEMSYNQEVQDWVWQDAIQVGNKIYHASCFGDLKRDGGNPPGGTSTPDSMLGKRKAEVLKVALTRYRP